MTQVVMVIMASDKQVKKSKRGFPRSSIMAKVTPKNTAMRHTETFNKPNRKQLFIPSYSHIVLQGVQYGDGELQRAQ